MHSSPTLDSIVQRPISDRPPGLPEPGTGSPLAPAATRLGAELLRLGRYREAESVLQRALTARDPRDRSTLFRSTLYLAEGARTAGKIRAAMSHYGRLLISAQQLGRWDYEAIGHAGLGLCLLEEARVDEAEDQWAYARAALGDRTEWFEDREILEIFIARVQVLNGSVELAEERLARTAQVLEGADPYRWAQVELERVLLLSQIDPDAARALLNRVARVTAPVDAPPLHERIAAIGRILEESPASRSRG